MSILERIEKNKDLDKVKERQQILKKFTQKEKRRLSKIRNANKRNSKK